MAHKKVSEVDALRLARDNSALSEAKLMAKMIGVELERLRLEMEKAETNIVKYNERLLLRLQSLGVDPETQIVVIADDQKIEIGTVLDKNTGAPVALEEETVPPVTESSPAEVSKDAS